MVKSKDDYKLKRSSPSSPRGGDETRSKRHRSKDDEKKHKSRKDKKSHKISKRHSEKDKKSSSKKHKDKGRKNDNLSKLKIEELSKDDYFSKNNEFSRWLNEEKKVFFADLPSESARSLFSEFVIQWNNLELESEYYEGIVTAPRTSHKWNIKK